MVGRLVLRRHVMHLKRIVMVTLISCAVIYTINQLMSIVRVSLEAKNTMERDHEAAADDDKNNNNNSNNNNKSQEESAEDFSISKQLLSSYDSELQSIKFAVEKFYVVWMNSPDRIPRLRMMPDDTDTDEMSMDRIQLAPRYNSVLPAFVNNNDNNKNYNNNNNIINHNNNDNNGLATAGQQQHQSTISPFERVVHSILAKEEAARAAAAAARARDTESIGEQNGGRLHGGISQERRREVAWPRDPVTFPSPREYFVQNRQFADAARHSSVVYINRPPRMNGIPVMDRSLVRRGGPNVSLDPHLVSFLGNNKPRPATFTRIRHAV